MVSADTPSQSAQSVHARDSSSSVSPTSKNTALGRARYPAASSSARRVSTRTRCLR